MYRNHFSNSVFIKIFLLFTAIVVVNILTISSPLTLMVSLPEYAIVIFLLFKGDIKKSVLLHFVFAMLSLSAQGTLGMFESKDFLLYNYGTLKLVGPIRGCYIMNIIYCIVLINKKVKISESTLYYRLYKIMLYLCGSATLIGLGGILLSSYYSMDSFIDYGIYSFVVITTMFAIIRVADEEFINYAYHLTLACIMAGIAGSFLCYVSGSVTSHYSVFDIAYMADITILSLALVIGIPFIKQKGLLWLTLFLYAILLLTSLGGKSVIGLVFSICALSYLLFFDKETKSNLNRSDKKLRPFVVIVALGAVLYVIKNVASDSMAGYKFASAVSMFSGDLDNMSRSPYIRVASLLNVLNDGLSNPFALFFGNGFGGYFQDHLGLFVGIDLSNGAFKDEIIASGRFTTGHDTMVTVPLFNGLIGLFLVTKITWLYLKQINRNYMCSIAFLWLFLMFYFNTIYAMIGLFGLIGAEYKLKNR